jgi:two-component system, sensor histidine kinase YesM
LLVSCGIFIISLNRITARIKALVKKMQSSRNGEFSIIEDAGATDEIGVLTKSFNRMIENLQKSIIENYEVNLTLKDITIKKREAELYALQSQINPHFLFNTLESIRMGLHNKGDQETSSVVLSFSKLFRHLLNWEGELVALEEEIELVERYLNIQQYRFQDRITYQIEFPPDLKKTLIPKLTIQPLVENAVKHGIESIAGTGFISIKVVHSASDTMQIVVEDNGMGIPPVKLVAIQRELASEEMKKSGSIGLKNVHDRIVLHYGAGYGIAIEGNEPTGTRVTVRLPVQYPTASIL